MLRRRTRHWLVCAAVLAATAFLYWPALFGQVLAGRDIFRLFIPDAAFLRECLLAGEWPLWNPYTRMGQPFAATLYSQAFYPPRVLTVLVSDPATAITLEQIFHVLVAAFGVFTLCRTLRRSTLASCVAALLFAFGPTVTHLAMQQNVVDSAAWTGLLLTYAVQLSRRAGFREWLGLTLCSAASFLAGSPEVLLLQWVLVGAVLAGHARGWRSPATSALGALASVALCAFVAVPGLELAQHSTRASGMVERFEWSMPWAGLLSIFWPNADLPRETYWGDEQNFVTLLFVGSLACALAAAGVALNFKRRRVWGWAGATVFLALLALGRHFLPATWLLQLPPFSLFRYPSKYVLGSIFCLCILAAFGLDRLTAFALRVEPSRKRLHRALAAMVVLLVLAFTLTVTLPLRMGAMLNFLWPFVFLLGGVLVFFFVKGAGEASRGNEGAALAAKRAFGDPRSRALRVRHAWAFLLVVEWAAAHYFFDIQSWRPHSDMVRPSRLAQEIPRPFQGRLSVSLPDDDDEQFGRAFTGYIEKSRDALVPLRFVEEQLAAVEGYGAPDPLKISRALSKDSRAFFDFAGVEYYVRRTREPYPDARRLYGAPELPGIYRVATAAPRAFVVHSVKQGDAKAAYEFITDEEQPFRTTAFVEDPIKLEASDCTGSRAQVVESSPSHVEVLVDACAEGVAVLTDTFFPGWDVERNGEPVPSFRVDYLARGVQVPKGHHRLTFDYRPRSFRLGLAVSLFTVALIAAVHARRLRAVAARSAPPVAVAA